MGAAEGEKVLRWRLMVQQLMACSCNWGCPCSFQSPPTYGKCDGVLAFRVAEGTYGRIPLGGLKWTLAASWPGPIHEKGGRGIVYIDEHARGEKRDALEAIALGKAGGPPGIFMPTVTAGLEVRPGRIDFNFAGKKSSFQVADEVRVEFEAIRTITGAESFPSVALPTGMLTKKEDFYSAALFRVRTDGLSFEYPNRHASFFEATWRGP